MKNIKEYINKWPLLFLAGILSIIGVLFLIYDKLSYFSVIYSIILLDLALVINISILKRWKDKKVVELLYINTILLVSMLVGNFFHLLTYSNWFPIFYHKLNTISSVFYSLGALSLLIFLILLANILSTSWNKIGAIIDAFVIGIMSSYAIRFTLFPLVLATKLDVGLLTGSILIYLSSFVTTLVVLHYNKSNKAKKFSNILYLGLYIWVFSSVLLWVILYNVAAGEFFNILNILWSISYLFITIGVFYSQINIPEVIEIKSYLEREEKSLPLVIVFLLTAIIYTNPSMLDIVFFIVLIIFRFYIHRYILLYKENEEIVYEYKLVNLQLESKIQEINNLNKILERRVNLRKNSLETKNKELYKLANVDQLTGIPNRRHFIHYIEELIKKSLTVEENNYFSVLFIDLDQFKVINDNFGHDVGDKILIQTAERIRKSIEHKDFLARLGGDEFVVITKEYRSLEELEKKANRIIEEFQKPFDYEHQQIASTTSLGISMFPENGTNSSDLMRFADIALYHSKNTGKNKATRYSTDMI